MTSFIIDYRRGYFKESRKMEFIIFLIGVHLTCVNAKRCSETDNCPLIVGSVIGGVFGLALLLVCIASLPGIYGWCKKQFQPCCGDCSCGERCFDCCFDCCQSFDKAWRNGCQSCGDAWRACCTRTPPAPAPCVDVKVDPHVEATSVAVITKVDVKVVEAAPPQYTEPPSTDDAPPPPVLATRSTAPPAFTAA